MKTEELARAVVELRNHLNLIQVDFGRLLGVSLPTVQRYERLSAGPSPEAWKGLAELAVKSGRADIARVFIEAFREYWGPTLIGSAPQKKGNATEEKYVDILRDILRSEPEMARSLITWLDLFQQQRGKKR